MNLQKACYTTKDQRGNLLITIETTEDYVACRICKKKIYKRHGDDRERQLKHLPAFGHSTFIVYSPHRYICEDCQDHPTTTATPIWHSQNGSHTTEYENHLLMELVNIPITLQDANKGECNTWKLSVIRLRKIVFCLPIVLRKFTVAAVNSAKVP